MSRQKVSKTSEAFTSRKMNEEEDLATLIYKSSKTAKARAAAAKMKGRMHDLSSSSVVLSRTSSTPKRSFANVESNKSAKTSRRVASSTSKRRKRFVQEEKKDDLPKVARKKYRYICSAEGCTNLARKGGVCKANLNGSGGGNDSAGAGGDGDVEKNQQGNDDSLVPSNSGQGKGLLTACFRCSYPDCDAASHTTTECTLCLLPSTQYHCECKAAYEVRTGQETNLSVCFKHHPSGNEHVGKLNSLLQLVCNKRHQMVCHVHLGLSGDKHKDMVTQWNESFKSALKGVMEERGLAMSKDRKDLEWPKAPTVKDVEELFRKIEEQILSIFPCLLLQSSDVSYYMDLLAPAFSNHAGAAASSNSNNNVKKQKTTKGRKKKTTVRLQPGTEVQCQCCFRNLVAPIPKLSSAGVTTHIPILRTEDDIEGGKDSWKRQIGGAHDGLVYANPTQLRALTQWKRSEKPIHALWEILQLMPVQTFMNVYLSRANKANVDSCFSKLVRDVSLQGHGTNKVSSAALQTYFYTLFNEVMLERELYQKCYDSWHNNAKNILKDNDLDMKNIVEGWDAFKDKWHCDVMKVVPY
eukprot:scaffold29405_cov114-Skeletonema_menzelii.AAC.1